ncbi:MAG: substrate-binding domain-containing protein [Kiritimatiellaeota bacterium]|nr:substrate-binding domain-containing protein [Kiritimatiellota bacterium]
MPTRIKRESLVAQVVDILRRDLHRYVRFKWLPGERVLCERFHVSRTTMRAVLAQLQRQGLIRAVPCKGYCVQAKVHRSPQRPSRVIGCLVEAPFSVSEMQRNLLVRNVEHVLNTAGYEMEIEFKNRSQGRNAGQQLAGIVAAHPAACWALNSTSLATQRWFAHHKIPALIVGSCQPGICLPNLDIDYRAIGRHAVNFLWRQGHRHIAFLTPRNRLGGDILCETGFAEGWRQVAGNSVRPSILYHDGSVGGICRVLELAWTASVAPTALLVSHCLHTMTAAGYLIQCGLRLPQDISLVCRDYDEILSRFVPPVTCYVVDRNAYAQRCARTLIQMATAGHLRPQSRLLMARFTPGGTVTPPLHITHASSHLA